MPAGEVDRHAPALLRRLTAQEAAQAAIFPNANRHPINPKTAHGQNQWGQGYQKPCPLLFVCLEKYGCKISGVLVL
jgi:hypothetical protein